MLSNAIGLPPILCVFLVLAVCIGLLGIARTMIDGGPMTVGPTLVTRWPSTNRSVRRVGNYASILQNCYVFLRKSVLWQQRQNY